MTDDMEKKREQSGHIDQHGEHSGQHVNQPEKRGQPGQSGQHDRETGQKKSGHDQEKNENLDRQRRAS